MSVPPAAAVAALAKSIDGGIVKRGEASYESLRRALLWNRLTPERWPEVVVRAAGERDVVVALAFAREHGLRVGVRSGGHSWCGAPLREGSLLLDLGALDAVAVDPQTRMATVQPAVTNRELATALARHRLAFPYGHCASVGLGGFVLAGGLGWNTRSWGLACHNLCALDVVLADGQTVRASADENPDLLWAARGAGPGFFAVATRFHLNLHPLPSAIASSRCVYAIDDAATVAVWIESITATLPPEVELTLFVARGQNRSELVCIVAASAFVDSDREATRALRFMTDCPAFARAKEQTLLTQTPFDALFDGVGTMFLDEHRFATDAAWLAAPLPEVIGILARQLGTAPSARTFFLCAIAPAPAWTASADAAFSPHGALLVNTHAAWDEAPSDGANLAWHAETMAALAPLTAAHYVGEADIAARPDHARRAFTPAVWERLERLREHYDPGHLLHGWFS